MIAEITGFPQLVLGEDDGFVNVVALALFTDDRVYQDADKRLFDGKLCIGLEPGALS